MGDLLIMKSLFNIRGVGAALACAFVVLGPSSQARAEDFPIKAPPIIPDLTWNGITLIGVIDVGAQYEQFGAPYVGRTPSPAAQLVPESRSSQWLWAPNQTELSYVGFKVEEPVTSDLKFIARGEIGFDPTTGGLDDAVKSVKINDGIPLAQQTANGDGARAGQLFNGELWAGLNSNPWGTIRAGRNNAVSVDMLGAYDPLASQGFSLLGWVSLLSGQGSADTVRLDQSIKYLNSYGPFRTEIMYAAPNTNVKDFLQGTIGYVRPNFSVDLFAGHTSDSVAISPLSGAANLGSDFLGARVFDSDMYGVFGKYVFDVGGNGPLTTTESKFAVSGGYQRLVLMNPADGGLSAGHALPGGYEIGPIVATNGSAGAGIVNNSYTGGNRQVDISFIAGKFQYDAQLAFSLGYYRFDQNSFGFGVNNPAGLAPIYSTTNCSSSAFFNCAGSEYGIGFRTDYQWTKNLMAYAGVSYSKVSGGFAFSYIKTSTFDPTVGLKFSF
jgi:predicted porin